jgi:hypothetical protein
LNDLHLLYQNVRGLNSKIDCFYSYISDCECDLIGLTETWIQSDVSDSELFPGEYQVFRKDRDLEGTGYTTGGGVLVACKNIFKCTVVDTSYFCNNFPSIDLLICKCVIQHNMFFVIVTYTG